MLDAHDGCMRSSQALVDQCGSARAEHERIAPVELPPVRPPASESLRAGLKMLTGIHGALDRYQNRLPELDRKVVIGISVAIAGASMLPRSIWAAF